MRKRSWVARAQVWLDQKINFPTDKPLWTVIAPQTFVYIKTGTTWDMSMTMKLDSSKLQSIKVIGNRPVPYDWSEDPDA